MKKPQEEGKAITIRAWVCSSLSGGVVLCFALQACSGLHCFRSLGCARGVLLDPFFVRHKIFRDKIVGKNSGAQFAPVP